jgi:phosphoribosylformylglycinamidine synthase
MTGGNVSFGHLTGDVAIHPTPLVGVLGRLDDVTRRTPSGWREPGLALYLLGVTRAELAGSQWAWIEHRHLGGLPPTVDLAAEQRLAQALVEASTAGLLAAAHDLSEGGLARTLVEGCLRFGVGAEVSLAPVCERDGVSPFLALFAESTARVVVAARPDDGPALLGHFGRAGIVVARLGTTGGEAISVAEQFEVHLDQLHPA